MNGMETSTPVAGVDVSKLRLDVAVGEAGPAAAFANTAAGRDELVGWLGAQGVRRVGFEASGGYEQALRARLDAARFEVVMHQPLEVSLLARLTRRRAKNDRLDARLIALATARLNPRRQSSDPRMAEFAQRLTAYEQAADLVTLIKTHLEHTDLPDLVAALRTQLQSLIAHKRMLARALEKRLCAYPDLRRRFELLCSLPGVGPIVALGLCIRMPELGTMRRGQPAALIGVAPFDRDSGTHKGQRVIAGGRRRPRRLLYLAALAAKRCDPGFKAFAASLISRGKPAKVAIVAVMRKLIEAANLILARNTPWIQTPT